MISILIPVFNFDIRPLVGQLVGQCKSSGIPYEILCFDDGSETGFKEKNRLLEYDKVVYREMTKNHGRSAIRNVLGEAARFPYLLFMDCDSRVVASDYIKKYCDHLSPDTLLYGGRCYSPQKPKDPALLFHWTYGKKREESPAEKRRIHPWHSFMTNNFLIPKAVFQQINFDESLTQYGHEDTLFGLELARKNIGIKHLDNPLEHIGLEPVDIMIKKTEQGLQNLFSLWKKGTPIDTKLLNLFIRIKKKGMTAFIGRQFYLYKPIILFQLKSKLPSLYLFDFYKLLYLCHIDITSQNKFINKN